MSLQQILGQEKAIRLIRKAISHERIPHAWLFSGMAHIGKYKTALALAQTLNCLENGDDACGHCDFCRQIEHEHFPDFRVVRPEGKISGLLRSGMRWTGSIYVLTGRSTGC